MKNADSHGPSVTASAFVPSAIAPSAYDAHTYMARPYPDAVDC